MRLLLLLSAATVVCSAQPVAIVSTMIGGSGAESVRGVAIAPDGSIWIAGTTDSEDFQPSAEGAGRSGDDRDVFIVRLTEGFDASGARSYLPERTLFLGGGQEDIATSLTIAEDGSVLVGGASDSPDFPDSSAPEGPRGFLLTLEPPETAAALSKAGAPPKRNPAGVVDVTDSVYINDPDSPIGNYNSVEHALRCGDFVYMLVSRRTGLVTADQLSVQRLGLFVFRTGEPEPLQILPRLGLGGIDQFIEFSKLKIRNDPVTGEKLIDVAVHTGRNPGNNPEITSTDIYCLRVGSDGLITNAAMPRNRLRSHSFAGRGAREPPKVGPPVDIVHNDGRTQLTITTDGEFIEDSTAPITSSNPISYTLVTDSNVVHIEAPSNNQVRGEVAQLTNDRGVNAALVTTDSRFVARRVRVIAGSGTDNLVSTHVFGDSLHLAGDSDSTDIGDPFARIGAELEGSKAATALKSAAKGQGAPDSDVMVWFFDPADDRTIAAGFFGGGANERVVDSVIDAQGNLIIVGTTDGDMPTTDGSSFAGGATDLFIVKIGLEATPLLSSAGVVGAADFLNGALAPGAIVSVFAQGADELIVADVGQAGEFPEGLGGVRVLFDGEPGRMIFTSPGQTNLIAPFGLDSKASANVELEIDGTLSNAVQFDVQPTRPQLFTALQTGTGQAALLNQDFSPNSENNPAVVGSVVQIFLTGGGQTDPPGEDGALAPLAEPLPRFSDVRVLIGGIEATVVYGGAAPGLVHGVGQINAIVPEGVEPGAAVSLEVTIGGVSTRPGVTLAIAG